MRPNPILIVLALALIVTLWLSVNYDFAQGGTYSLIAIATIALFFALKGRVF